MSSLDDAETQEQHGGIVEDIEGVTMTGTLSKKDTRYRVTVTYDDWSQLSFGVTTLPEVIPASNERRPLGGFARYYIITAVDRNPMVLAGDYLTLATYVPILNKR
jgi:hypothetical protein